MEKSETIKELATALCKFQGEVETIKKTEVNPFFKSKYADLSSILDVVRQPLSNNGLSFVQFPKGKYELETMLMHTSGEWLTGTYEMKPTKDDPQGAGSVITYQRRYALGAILGLSIDVDDDGNKASAPPKEAEKTTPTTAEKANESKQLISASEKLNACTKIEDVKKVWELMPSLHEHKVFIKMVTEAKAKLTVPTN